MRACSERESHPRKVWARNISKTPDRGIRPESSPSLRKKKSPTLTNSWSSQATRLRPWARDNPATARIAQTFRIGSTAHVSYLIRTLKHMKARNVCISDLKTRRGLSIPVRTTTSRSTGLQKSLWRVTKHRLLTGRLARPAWPAAQGIDCPLKARASTPSPSLASILTNYRAGACSVASSKFPRGISISLSVSFVTLLEFCSDLCVKTVLISQLNCWRSRLYE